MNLLKNKTFRLLGLLSLSLSMASCLGDPVEYEYSSDATVQAFELDKVLGKNYKFDIDHGAGKIYNVDSLPVQSDTIIDRIRITKLTVLGGYSMKSAAGEDSLFNIADSLDLRGTMEILPDGTPGKPFVFKVWAPDGIHTKEYSLSVRVHQQHGDSLQWGATPVATDYTSMSGYQKAVLLNNQILVYYIGQNSKVLTGAVDAPTTWKEQVVTGLPAEFDYSSVLNYGGKLFASTSAGEVYESQDGLQWQKNEPLSSLQVSRLLVAFSEMPAGAGAKAKGISAVVNQEGTSKFAFAVDGSVWTVGNVVPENFPQEHISSAVYKNNLGVHTAIAVGDKPADQITAADTSTVVWSTTDGMGWYPLRTESVYDCPRVRNPFVMYYNKEFYLFGSDFATIYHSKDGLVWKSMESRFMFPESIRNRESAYSAVIDEQGFIWLLHESPAEIWRGRLNVLGFKVR